MHGDEEDVEFSALPHDNLQETIENTLLVDSRYKVICSQHCLCMKYMLMKPMDTS